MNKWILVGGILLVLVVVVGALIFFISSAPPPEPGTQPGGSGLPVATSTGTTGPTIMLETNTGSSIPVPDFTKNKPSYNLPSGTYYQITNNQEREGRNAKFDVTYGTDSSIAVTLLKEPLSSSRLAAEATLRDLLQLPDATMCTLKIDLGVPYSINQFYSGQNLGLSFCSDAVTLP